MNKVDLLESIFGVPDVSVEYVRSMFWLS